MNGDQTALRGLRVLLADDDPARADAVAQQLRSLGAVVVITDLVPTPLRFMRLRQLDPAVLLMDKEHLGGSGYPLVHKLRSDQRLRWASLLVVDWSDIWPEQSVVLHLDPLLAKLSALAEPEQQLIERVRTERALDTALEATGPARLLRALVETDLGLGVDVHGTHGNLHFDLSPHLVVGGNGEIHQGSVDGLRGAGALAAFLELTSGRVHVEHREPPTTGNLMATLSAAFEMANQEPLPFQPSPVPEPALLEVASTPGRPFATRLGTMLLATGFGLLLLLGGALVLLGRENPEASPSSQSRHHPWYEAIVRVPLFPASHDVGLPKSSSGQVGSVSRVNETSRLAKASSASAFPRTDASARFGIVPSAEATPEALANADERRGTSGQRAPGYCTRLVADNPLHLGKARNFVPGTENNEAFRAFLRGDRHGAEVWYCRVLERDDGDRVAAFGLARLLLLRRDAEAAVYYAGQGLLAHPEDVRLKGILGDGWALLGDEIRARKAWSELARDTMAGDPEEVLRKLGERELAAAERANHENRSAEAERLARRAVIILPPNHAACMALARALVAQGQSALAIPWARRATEQAPHSLEAWLTLGDTLWRAGDREGARLAWEEAQTLGPQNPQLAHRMIQLRAATAESP